MSRPTSYYKRKVVRQIQTAAHFTAFQRCGSYGGVDAVFFWG